MRLFSKCLATMVSLVYFLSNCALAHSTESNIWNERQKTSNPAQFAALPLQQNVLPVNFSPPVSALNPTSLPQRLKKQVPKNMESTLLPLLASLSSQYGTVRKIQATPNARKTIVHIQDIHLNAEAQSNIGHTVGKLIADKKIALIGLEGAFAPIELSVYRAFENKESINIVGEYLLRENRISGAVHAAFTSPTEIPFLVGIDDKSHYDANIKAYQDSLINKEADKKAWEKLQAQHDKAAVSGLNPNLSKFYFDLKAYYDDRINMAGHVATLAQAVSSTSPNIEIFLEAAKLERAIDFKKVENERTALLSQLLTKLSKKENDDLINTSIAYRLGNINHADFYERLKHLCERKNLSLAHFKSMDTYIQYVLLSDGINGEQLISDISAMENEVAEKLVQSPEERKFLAESRKLWLQGKLLDFALTPEEWTAYKAADHSPSTIVPSPKFFAYEKFYLHALARNKSIADNLLRSMDDNNASVAILVTGGFHSPGIDQLLKEAGATTITFVPKMSEVKSENGSSYLSVFAQEKTPLDQLFSGEKLFVGQNPAQTGLAPPLMEAAATHLKSPGDSPVIVKGEKGNKLSVLFKDRRIVSVIFITSLTALGLAHIIGTQTLAAAITALPFVGLGLISIFVEKSKLKKSVPKIILIPFIILMGFLAPVHSQTEPTTPATGQAELNKASEEFKAEFNAENKSLALKAVSERDQAVYMFLYAAGLAAQQAGDVGIYAQNMTVDWVNRYERNPSAVVQPMPFAVMATYLDSNENPYLIINEPYWKDLALAFRDILQNHPHLESNFLLYVQTHVVKESFHFEFTEQQKAYTAIQDEFSEALANNAPEEEILLKAHRAAGVWMEGERPGYVWEWRFAWAQGLRAEHLRELKSAVPNIRFGTLSGDVFILEKIATDGETVFFMHDTYHRKFLFMNFAPTFLKTEGPRKEIFKHILAAEEKAGRIKRVNGVLQQNSIKPDSFDFLKDPANFSPAVQPDAARPPLKGIFRRVRDKAAAVFISGFLTLFSLSPSGAVAQQTPNTNSLNKPSVVKTIIEKDIRYLEVNGTPINGYPGYTYSPTPDGHHIADFVKEHNAQLFLQLFPKTMERTDPYYSLWRKLTSRKNSMGTVPKAHARILLDNGARYITVYDLSQTTSSDLKDTSKIFEWMRSLNNGNGLMLVAGLGFPTPAQARMVANELKDNPALLYYFLFNEENLLALNEKRPMRWKQIFAAADATAKADPSHPVGIHHSMNELSAEDVAALNSPAAKNIRVIGFNLYGVDGAAAAKFLEKMAKLFPGKIIVTGEVGVPLHVLDRSVKMNDLMAHLTSPTSPSATVAIMTAEGEEWKGDDNVWDMIGTETFSSVEKVLTRWRPGKPQPSQTINSADVEVIARQSETWTGNGATSAFSNGKWDLSNAKSIRFIFPIETIGTWARLRLLPEGADSTTPTGATSKAYPIIKEGNQGIIEVPIEDFPVTELQLKAIIQLSLHMGKAWDKPIVNDEDKPQPADKTARPIRVEKVINKKTAQNILPALPGLFMPMAAGTIKRENLTLAILGSLGIISGHSWMTLILLPMFFAALHWKNWNRDQRDALSLPEPVQLNKAKWFGGIVVGSFILVLLLASPALAFHATQHLPPFTSAAFVLMGGIPFLLGWLGHEPANSILLKYGLGRLMLNPLGDVTYNLWINEHFQAVLASDLPDLHERGKLEKDRLTKALNEALKDLGDEKLDEASKDPIRQILLDYKQNHLTTVTGESHGFPIHIRVTDNPAIGTEMNHHGFVINRRFFTKRTIRSVFLPLVLNEGLRRFSGKLDPASTNNEPEYFRNTVVQFSRLMQRNKNILHQWEEWDGWKDIENPNFFGHDWKGAFREEYNAYIFHQTASDLFIQDKPKEQGPLQHPLVGSARLVASVDAIARKSKNPKHIPFENPHVEIVMRTNDETRYLLISNHGSENGGPSDLSVISLKPTSEWEKFENNLVYEVGGIFNPEDPDITENNPSRPRWLTGRELTQLGIELRYPLPEGGVKILKISPVMDAPPDRRNKSEKVQYSRLLLSSLQRYSRRFSPNERFQHSFVARELVDILLVRNEENFFDFFKRVADLINDPGQGLWVGDFGAVLHDLQTYRPELKEYLHRYLVHMAIRTEDSDIQYSDLALKLLRSSGVGEVVYLSTESDWTTQSGGLATFITELTKEMADLGVNITVILPLFTNHVENFVKVFKGYNTGRTVRVNFAHNTHQVAEIYEANISNVRVLGLVNDPIFHRLNDHKSRSFYDASGPFTLHRLKSIRMLSMGGLLTIVAMKIHASIVVGNDWQTAGIGPIFDGEEAVDPSTVQELNESPNLDKVTAIATFHQPEYQGYIGNGSEEELAYRLYHGLGLSRERHGGFITQGLGINPLMAAVSSRGFDAIFTVSRGQKDETLQPNNLHRYFPLPPLLQERENKGEYLAEPNGTSQIGLQISFFLPALRQLGLAGDEVEAFSKNSFFGIGNPAAQVRLAMTIFNEIIPNRKAFFQGEFGLEADNIPEEHFLMGFVHRIAKQKGYQLLLAPIWNKAHPHQLEYEGQMISLSSADQEKLEKHASETQQDSITMAEVLLLLLKNSQLMIGGKLVDEWMGPQFERIKSMLPKERFNYSPKWVKKFDAQGNFTPIFLALYTGLSAFLMPSEVEPGGISDKEAAAGGTPQITTRAGGLKDAEVSLELSGNEIKDKKGNVIATIREKAEPEEGSKHEIVMHGVVIGDIHLNEDGKILYKGIAVTHINEAFDLFNPVAMFEHTRFLHFIFTEYPTLWLVLRIQNILQDNRWKRSAKAIIGHFNNAILIKQGKETSNGAFNELPVLEVMSAINKYQIRKAQQGLSTTFHESELIAEIQIEGYTAVEAIEILLDAYKRTTDPLLGRSIEDKLKEFQNPYISNEFQKYLSKIWPTLDEGAKKFLGKLTPAKTSTKRRKLGLTIIQPLLALGAVSILAAAIPLLSAFNAFNNGLPWFLVGMSLWGTLRISKLSPQKPSPSETNILSMILPSPIKLNVGRKFIGEELRDEQFKNISAHLVFVDTSMAAHLNQLAAAYRDQENVLFVTQNSSLAEQLLSLTEASVIDGQMEKLINSIGQFDLNQIENRSEIKQLKQLANLRLSVTTGEEKSLLDFDQLEEGSIFANGGTIYLVINRLLEVVAAYQIPIESRLKGTLKALIAA